ncbi:MAG: hypothetical protein IJM76_09370 [Lachnospiraceae bacterium]|nr:hypothetical protein [Lachnospiraceae bacterium]
MNDDIYAEWLVARKKAPFRIPALLGIGILILVSALLVFVNSWFTLLLVAVIVGSIYATRFLRVEYEYTFITNELVIDAIYSQQIRKNKKKIEMSSMEYVEPTNEEKNKNLLAGKTVVLEDFSSGVAGTPSYTIRYNSGGKQALLVFEPNDKLIHAMWRCAPGKVQVRR